MSHTLEEMIEFAGALNEKTMAMNHGYGYDWGVSKEDGEFVLMCEFSGDWKHDHLFCEYIAKEWLDENGLHGVLREEVTEEDGSDWYGAVHTCTIL